LILPKRLTARPGSGLADGCSGGAARTKVSTFQRVNEESVRDEGGVRDGVGRLEKIILDKSSRPDAAGGPSLGLCDCTSCFVDFLCDR
jgi:hypothetical protein